MGQHKCLRKLKKIHRQKEKGVRKEPTLKDRVYFGKNRDKKFYKIVSYVDKPFNPKVNFVKLSFREWYDNITQK